jgi:hypothetical protein
MAATLAYIPLVPGRAPSNVAAGSPSTTLNGATLVNATTATLTSATGITPGQVLLIDTAGNAEVALVTAVAGNVVTFSQGLAVAHSSGAAVSVAVIPQAPAEHAAATVRSPYLAGG